MTNLIVLTTFVVSFIAFLCALYYVQTYIIKKIDEGYDDIDWDQ